MIQLITAKLLGVIFNPFTANPITALHFAMLVQPTMFNFWHLGALALRTERQSARMSKIKNGGLDQYGAELFEQQQFETAGIEEVKNNLSFSDHVLKCCSQHA